MVPHKSLVTETFC